MLLYYSTFTCATPLPVFDIKMYYKKLWIKIEVLNTLYIWGSVNPPDSLSLFMFLSIFPLLPLYVRGT